MLTARCASRHALSPGLVGRFAVHPETAAREPLWAR